MLFQLLNYVQKMSFFRKIYQFINRKFFKIGITLFVLVFAFIGFGLTSTYFAVKWNLTDDPGRVDYNDRYYREMAIKHGKEKKSEGTVADKEAVVFNKIALLYQYAPKNAQLIHNAYVKTKNVEITEMMLDAVNVYLIDDDAYQDKLGELEEIDEYTQITVDSNIFEWMNMSEWEDFKIVLKKEADVINRVGKETGVEPRLIAAMVTGEQIRLFDSEREAYKKWMGPLKLLSSHTKFAWGVTGIKPETAMRIEKYLNDENSVFYLGDQYRNLLDFKTENIENERFERITDFYDHYYAYLYAALNVKMIYKQWERAGYDISGRPEILATLYNLGFDVSQPKSNPRVGGSNVSIKGKPYTFGALAYEFYFSAELLDEFPYMTKRFTE